MKLRIACVTMLSLVLSAESPAQDKSKDMARTPVMSLDKLDWLVGTGEALEPLREDIPGIGKKGDMATLRVTTAKALNDTFLTTTGWVIKEGEKREVFHEIWGMKPSSLQLHKWYFDRGGVAFEGKVYWEGDDRVVHVIEGKAIPKDETLKQMAEQMNVTEMNYSAEVVFRRADERSIGVTVQSVKVAGVPFPWPNLGKESIYQKVEQR